VGDLLSVHISFQFPLVAYFDIVGWATGRASGM